MWKHNLLVRYGFLAGTIFLALWLFQNVGSVAETLTELGLWRPLAYFATILLAVIVGAGGLMAYLWIFVIGEDFMEMGPPRAARSFRQWDRRRAAEEGLARRRLEAYGVPAPWGKEELRDHELEQLLREGEWDLAEEYLRERLERHHAREGDPNTRKYLFYLEYLLFLRGKRASPPGVEG